MRTVAAAIALTVLALVGVGVAWAADRAAPSPLTSDARPAPLVIPVSIANRSRSIGVGVVTESAPGHQAVSATSGTLTAVLAKPGDTLATGDPVVVVDDRTIRALVAERPLWRDLTVGKTGPDVRAVQTLLAALGYLDAAPDGAYGAATRAAVRALDAAEGRRTDGATFPRSAVTWIGAEPLAVAGVDVTPGHGLEGGTAVLHGAERAVAVTVSEPAGSPPLEGAAELVVGTARVPYKPGSGRVTVPDHVAVIAAQIGAAGESTGQVVEADQRTVTVVPATAVVTDDDGTSCVFPSVDGAPVPVTVTGGGLASTDIADAGSLTEVLANPRTVRQELACS